MQISYSQISKYRKELMGLAILMIMIAHNTVDKPGLFHLANSAIQVICQVGVDMFFFFSGFGCFYSMRKDESAVSFYRKRLLRIFPVYFIVVVIYGLYAVAVSHEPISEYLWKVSLWSFFKGGVLNEWFIASILVMYLIFPLLYKILKKSDNIFIGLIIALYLFELLTALKVFPFLRINDLVIGIFVIRIPTFLLGSLMAKWSLNDKHISLSLAWLIIVSGVITNAVSLYFYHMKHNYRWIIMRVLFIVLTMAIIFLWIIIRTAPTGEGKVCSVFSRFLNYIGAITLELYLIHEKLIHVMTVELGRYIPGSHVFKMLVINILAVIASIFLANYLRRFTSFISKKKRLSL